jgi:hypothetical protein
VKLIVLVILGHFFIHDRSRSGEAHLSTKNVPQLRELVHTGLVKKVTDARKARVVAQLVVLLPLDTQIRIVLRVLRQQALRVGVHRAEL